MFCVLCVIIGLGILNEFLYIITKYNSKKSRYVQYLGNLLGILLFAYFVYKEEKMVNQIVYAIGSFMFLFQLIERIRNDVRNKSCIRLVYLKRFFVISLFDITEKKDEHIKKINMVFEVLNEVDSYGTIFLLSDSKEKTTKILMLINYAVQLSKIKDVCDMLGECAFCRENEKRKRCAIMLKVK